MKERELVLAVRSLQALGKADSGQGPHIGWRERRGPGAVEQRRLPSKLRIQGVTQARSEECNVYTENRKCNLGKYFTCWRLVRMRAQS